MGQIAVRWCKGVGFNLYPWQNLALHNSLLGGVGGSRWASRDVAAVITRQQGKTKLLVARALFGLFMLPHERTIVFTAHLVNTAKEAFREMVQTIDANPELKARVQAIHHANGNEGIELRDGSRIRFMARSKGSVRGWKVDLLICDEAYDLTEDEMAALTPTLTQSSNPQLWYASSTGMPDSYVLNNVRERGIAKAPGLAYFEWSAPEDAANDDLAAILQANPSLGISNQTIEDVWADLENLEEERYRRERLGILAPIGGESFIPAKLWAEARGEVEFSPRIAFAVDVPPERDRAVIAAASMDEDGKVSVEVVDAAEGTEWVATALSTLQGMHNPVTTVIDAGGAAGVLIKDLRRERVKLTQLQYRAYGQACGAFLDLVNQGKLTHSGQTELDRAADAARQSMMGDTLWKWSRKDVEADISPLVAVTLAVHGVLSRNKSSDKRKVVMV